MAGADVEAPDGAEGSQSVALKRCISVGEVWSGVGYAHTFPRLVPCFVRS